MPDSVREKRLAHTDYTASESVRQSGFIAQEVEKAMKESSYDFNGLHKPADKNDNYSLAYSEFVVPLVKAVQEQQRMISNLSKENETLRKRLDLLERKAENDK